MSKKNELELNPSQVWMRTQIYCALKPMEYFEIEILDKKEPLRFMRWKDQKTMKEHVGFGFWTGQGLKRFQYLDSEGHEVFSSLSPKFGKVWLKYFGEEGLREFPSYNDFISELPKI